MSYLSHPGRLLVTAALFAAGCAVTPGSPPEQTGTGQSAIEDGTPEAVGVLAFLDAKETTVAVLDDDVPLDKRAAQNLIAHRDGADGVRGTGDDDPFDDMTEVDDVPWVGPAAMSALLAYAEAHGYVPSGGDVLGVYDSVAFTVDEANATLDFVNAASHDTLDVDAGLDSRAVDSILAARPIASVLQLSGLYYVGHSAMLKLREYPKTHGGTKVTGDQCTASAECQSGLCGGLTLWAEGFCLESWMQGTFQSSGALAIPDDGTPVTSDILVSGQATVPLDVVVTLHIDHPRPQDLVVGLHQPGGAYAVLWDHQANPPTTITNPPGIEGDNMVNGTWTLEVTDTVTGETGTVKDWSMWLTSNWD